MQQSPNFWWFLAYLSAFHHLQCLLNDFSNESINFKKETGQKHNPILEFFAFVVLIFFATASYGQIQLPQAVAQKLHSVERLCNAVVKLFPICQLPWSPPWHRFHQQQKLHFLKRHLIVQQNHTSDKANKTKGFKVDLMGLKMDQVLLQTVNSFL